MSPTSTRGNPFPGLRPFETRDKILYFGREEQVASVLARLKERRFLAIVGTSGSGKSSLVRAGLIPGLHGGFMTGAGPNWKIAVLRPGGDPMGNLAKALAGLDLAGDVPDPVGFVRTTLSRSALGLTECVGQAGLPKRYNLLVVVDQFEELFRFRAHERSLEEEAGGFVRLLLEAVRQRDLPIYVVLTMRSDFLGDCAEFPGLAETINDGEYLVPRMNREQYRLAIEGPVRVGGGSISVRLVQRLLNDMQSSPDPLPVLQHALMRTWDRWSRERRPGEPMDVEDYEAVGTLAEALSRHADEVYLGLADEGERGLAARVFKALTESSAGGRGLRRPTRLRVLGRMLGVPAEALVRVIDPFRRPGRTFLTPGMDDGEDSTDRDEEVAPSSCDATGGGPRARLDDDTVIDISHESLMRVWTRLQTWVREEALSASIYRRLAESARLREEGRFDCLRDPELQVALNWRAQESPNAAWAERYAPDFEKAMALLDASARLRDETRLAQARRRRVVLATVSVVAAVFFLLWLYATIQHRRASARWLAMRADDLAGVDPRESVVVARHAVRTAALKESYASLRGAIWESRLLEDGWMLPTGVIHGARGNADASHFVVLVDSNAWVLAPGKREPIHRLAAHSGRVRSARFNGDGSRLLTAGEDGTGVIWDAGGWRPQHRLEGHRSGIPQGDFAEGGGHVATASLDGTARVWDAASGALLATLTPGISSSGSGEGRVRAVAFGPDGERIALGSEGGGLTLWNWRTTTRLWTGVHGDGDGDDVLDLRFSRDGRRLGSAGSDGKATIWEERGDTWVEAATLDLGLAGAGKLETAFLDFSPGGRLLLVSNDRRAAQIWEWPSRTLLFNLRHHDDEGGLLTVVSGGVSKDGRTVLTAANRDLVRLWETGVRELPSTPGWPASRWNEVRWAVFAPSGRQWMVGVREGNATNAYVLDYPNPSEATRLEGHRTNVVGAVFGRRGERAVTADAEGRLAIRDAPAWNAGRWIEASPSPVRGMALSPDGRWFAVADGNAVRVLDAADWRETVRLEKHGGPVLGVAFGSDSRVLASAGADAKVHLWRVPEWTPLVGDGVSHGARVNAVAFSPGERLLGTASDEIRLLLWNDGVRDRERMGRSSKEDSGFVRLAFTPSGECAISTDDSGWVELWDVAMHRRVGYLPQAKSGGEVIAVFTPDERELVAVGAGGMGLVYESVAWRSRRELVAETDRR